MKKILLATALLLPTLAAAGYYYMYMHPEDSDPQTNYKVITTGSERLTVEVADTEAARIQGLSGRASLTPADGMLFIFDHEEFPGIWMKDMQFSIDIIWLDADGTVVTIKENASPDSYPTVFQPTKPAKYVVELPAGDAAKRGIAEGIKFVL